MIFCLKKGWNYNIRVILSHHSCLNCNLEQILKYWIILLTNLKEELVAYPLNSLLLIIINLLNSIISLVTSKTITIKITNRNRRWIVEMHIRIILEMQPKSSQMIKSKWNIEAFIMQGISWNWTQGPKYIRDLNMMDILKKCSTH